MIINIINKGEKYEFNFIEAGPQRLCTGPCTGNPGAGQGSACCCRRPEWQEPRLFIERFRQEPLGQDEIFR